LDASKGAKMSLLIDMAEYGLLPGRLIRFGIRQLDRKRLREENRGGMILQRHALDRFISVMYQSPIAIQTAHLLYGLRGAVGLP
jgi:hypothetical protein